MPLHYTVIPKLRTLKYPVFKSCSNVTAFICYKLPLEFQQNNAEKRLLNIFRCSVNNIQYNSHFSWIQRRQFCYSAQNVNDMSNKVINTFLSKEFEKDNKLSINSFFDSICESKELSVIEWDSLKELLLKMSGIFNEVNFNGLVMKNLTLKNNYPLARSFMRYLEIKNQQPNLFTLSTFMKLSGKNIKECGEEDIINMYHKIKDLKVMDSILTENVVYALSVTSHWKEGYKIYKKATNNIAFYVLNSLACAAIHYHNFDIALELIKDFENYDNSNWNNVCIEWLNAVSDIYLKNSQESSLLLTKLLTLLHSKEIIVSKKSAELLSCHFESLKDEDWKGTFVTISKRKTCPNCNQPLQLIEVTTDQYQMLKEAVLVKIIKGSDVFLNTTPVELDRFKNFLISTVPYDIVIDGLNVAYYYMHNSSNLERARQLFLVVNHFAIKKGMKTLVLGRKHMRKWPMTFMEPISRMAKAFYTDNISKDDPFVLYATLMSGPKTMLLTKDIFRDHKFWLKDSLLSKNFELWRKSHQIFLTRVNESGTVVCEEPLPYSIVVQGSMEEGWHIPYELSDDEQTKSVYDFHKNWLCIRKKK